jgi:hypothetical protein
VHAARCTKAAKVPAVQLAQLVAPSASAYWPTAHATQLEVPPSEYFPAEHRLQDVDAVRTPYRPAPHALHRVAAAALYLPARARTGINNLHAWV